MLFVAICNLVSCVASSIVNLKGSDWLGMGVEVRVQKAFLCSMIST